MRNPKRTPDEMANPRPAINIGGVAMVLGVSTSTLYRRIERKRFSLDGIPVRISDGGNFYDMEAVFQRIFPSADSNTIAGLMYHFMQNNRDKKGRGLIK